MTSIGYWQGVGLCGLAAFALGAAAQDSAPKWGPHIDFEAKPGSKRTLGEADLFLPLAQDERTLLFANLRARYGDDSGREGNLGLGVRHMLESGWNLGAYGYVDRRRSPDTGFYYHQATFGAEALGRDWDLRTNAYRPQGTRVREVSTTPGVSSAALAGTSILVTTSAGLTQEERALKGFDGELGWRTPLFDSEAARQLRLYAGGYRFSDDTLKVQGPRVRAELALEDLTWFGPGTALYLGAEAQHDGARGDQTFLSLRLRIPLGKESARATPLSAQERRMAAPVMRDVDIVTQRRSFVTTPGSVETATATAGGSPITVLDSASTTGAALPGAVATAGANSTVILRGIFNTTATTTLQSGQTVMGAGRLTVTTPSGRTASLTLAPGATINSTIAGNFVASVAMADHSTLTGMTVVRNDSGFNNPITVYADTVSNVTIANNTISVSGSSFGPYGVYISSSSNVTVSGNTISASQPSGTSVALRVGTSSVTVTNNTLNASGLTPIAVNLSFGNLTIQPGSTGNVFTGGTCNVMGGIITGSLGYSSGGIAGTCP
jgi:hypothetical protein